jgi:hypothetical protein
MVHHLGFTDAMTTIDSGITHQSFLLADGFPDLTDAVKTVDSECLLNKKDLDEIKASIDTLNYAVAAGFIATGALWFDLKQSVAGLLNEQQERALADVTTELTVDAGNIAVIELNVPKRLRGFNAKSFTLESKDEGKMIKLVFSHEGIVETWEQHLPATKIVELEAQKKYGLSYACTKEETAPNCQRATLRIELTKPLAPRPYRLLA